MIFPGSLDDLPDDWRAALANRRLLWEGGYDPALVAVRDRDYAKTTINEWFIAFMWLFYSRDPQEWSESCEAFTMPEEWMEIVIPPAPSGQLPSLRAALTWRFARFYGVEFNDPAVVASVEYAFSKNHRAGPIGYLAATANRLWLAASRWRKYQRQAEQFPMLRLMADDHLSAQTGVAKLHGVLLPIDHEFWGACFPPNHVWHVGMVGQVTERIMRQKGWTVTQHLPDEWRSLIPTGFDRNFAALWPNVIEPGLVSM
ncbi:hypothetical protein IP68_04830 [Blastomonas sp. AAP25]|uniref:hypothetical protein n=1 Tax=Blastomonas sp. AAP25 TaxID=1523416 RepID=UPI0006B96D62|nr:hypothetical protein [Blastomonas sp. AAP25]KPF75862.1 hypothetical protein IP68_04830 [Blastomonas sp. AAP25]